VLEGLPINQYREVEITIGANAGDNKPAEKGAWPELPMPRDSHMLPEHSQQLLRAARSGRVYKPPAPPEDDNEMKDEEEESKEVQTGFTVKKYMKVARHLEATEPEYLAKRRKGLPYQYAVSGMAQPALRETKVRKLDAEGNATVYKVLVPEGQVVEGEVQPTDEAIEAVPAIAAPGTIVEGVGIVNAQGVVVASDILQQTPPRRRPPPPKKKRAGPGRGKKKVVFVEGAAEQGAPAPSAGNELLAVPGVKREGASVEPSEGDTPMADAGEAGGDDEEGSGEEGSDDDDHDGEHTSNPATPATPARPSTAPTSVPNPEAAETNSLGAAADAVPVAPTTEGKTQPPATNESTLLEEKEQRGARDRSSSPELPLSTISHSRQNSLNQLPTSATSTEPESMIIEQAAESVPVPATEFEPVPVAAIASQSATESQHVTAPFVDSPSAPSPSEPDLMASLDRHLEKDSEDIAGA
jgi:hypothetical protein